MCLLTRPPPSRHRILHRSIACIHARPRCSGDAPLPVDLHVVRVMCARVNDLAAIARAVEGVLAELRKARARVLHPCARALLTCIGAVVLVQDEPVAQRTGVRAAAAAAAAAAAPAPAASAAAGAAAGAVDTPFGRVRAAVSEAGTAACAFIGNHIVFSQLRGARELPAFRARAVSVAAVAV
jgi:hypothetical protein